MGGSDGVTTVLLDVLLDVLPPVSDLIGLGADGPHVLGSFPVMKVSPRYTTSVGIGVGVVVSGPPMMLPPDPCRWVPSCSTNTSSSRVRIVSSVDVDGVIVGLTGVGGLTDPGP